LINSAVVALQEGRLRFGANVPELETLMDELLAYRVRINLQTGHDMYTPWREGAHDDLLFSVSLACWAWGFTKRIPQESA
jgi:hypothetical protein